MSIRNFVSSKRHISYYAALLHVHVTVNRGGSRTFKTGGVRGGGGRPRRGRTLRSKVCFDAPSHIPYVFVRRVVNNIHFVNTAFAYIQ